MGMKKSELKQLKQLGIFQQLFSGAICRQSRKKSPSRGICRALRCSAYLGFLGSANDGGHPWTRGISQQPSPGPWIPWFAGEKLMKTLQVQGM